MEDIDESSSETYIKVDGIYDFPEDRYAVNKKAYRFRLTNDADEKQNTIHISHLIFIHYHLVITP